MKKVRFSGIKCFSQGYQRTRPPPHLGARCKPPLPTPVLASRPPGPLPELPWGRRQGLGRTSRTPHSEYISFMYHALENKIFHLKTVTLFNLKNLCTRPSGWEATLGWGIQSRKFMCWNGKARKGSPDTVPWAEATCESRSLNQRTKIRFTAIVYLEGLSSGPMSMVPTHQGSIFAAWHIASPTTLPYRKTFDSILCWSNRIRLLQVGLGANSQSCWDLFVEINGRLFFKVVNICVQNLAWLRLVHTHLELRKKRGCLNSENVDNLPETSLYDNHIFYSCLWVILLLSEKTAYGH